MIHPHQNYLLSSSLNCMFVTEITAAVIRLRILTYTGINKIMSLCVPVVMFGALSIGVAFLAASVPGPIIQVSLWSMICQNAPGGCKNNSSNRWKN